MINPFKRKPTHFIDMRDFQKKIEILSLHQWQQETRKTCIKNSSLLPSEEQRAENKKFRENIKTLKDLQVLSY